MIKKILAKLLFCPEEYVDNVLLHIPVGWGLVILARNPVLSVLLGVYFLAYEWIEQCDLKDKAYQDLKGAMWGIVTLAIPLLAAGIL